MHKSLKIPHQMSSNLKSISYKLARSRVQQLPGALASRASERAAAGRDCLMRNLRAATRKY